MVYHLFNHWFKEAIALTNDDLSSIKFLQYNTVNSDCQYYRVHIALRSDKL